MRKKFLSIVIVSIVTACSYLLMGAGFSVSAAEQGEVVIEADPAIQEFDLAPGQKYQGQVKISNRGKQGFRVKVGATPYMVEEDYDNNYTTETIYTKLYNWLKFEESEFDLASGESKTIKFTIDTPLDAPGGGQYATVTAETQGGQDGMLKKTARIASILIARVDGEISEAAELKKSVIPNFLIGDKISVSATVENTGNVDFRLNQTMTVRDFFNGRTVFSPSEISDEGDSKATVDKTGRFSGVVFPGTTRTGTVTWEEGSPSFGLFKVEQTVRFLDQNLTFEGVVFVCPWWLLIAVIAFIVLLILWIVLIIIKHHKKKSAMMM